MAFTERELSRRQQPLAPGEQSGGPELLGQHDAVLDQLPRSARVMNHEVCLTFVELQKIAAEAVAGRFGYPSRVFAIGNRLSTGALMAIGHGAVVVGGGLRERVPQRLGEAKTMVGVAQGSAEIAERCQGDAGVAGSSGFLSGVPDCPHLLDASRQQ